MEDLLWVEGQAVGSAVWLGISRHRKDVTSPWLWYYDDNKGDSSNNEYPSGKSTRSLSVIIFYPVSIGLTKSQHIYKFMLVFFFEIKADCDGWCKAATSY